jgi:hypothetical protein
VSQRQATHVRTILKQLYHTREKNIRRNKILLSMSTMAMRGNDEGKENRGTGPEYYLSHVIYVREKPNLLDGKKKRMKEFEKGYEKRFIYAKIHYSQAPLREMHTLGELSSPNGQGSYPVRCRVPTGVKLGLLLAFVCFPPWSSFPAVLFPDPERFTFGRALRLKLKRFTVADDCDEGIIGVMGVGGRASPPVTGFGVTGGGNLLAVGATELEGMDCTIGRGRMEDGTMGFPANRFSAVTCISSLLATCNDTGSASSSVFLRDSSLSRRKVSWSFC